MEKRIFDKGGKAHIISELWNPERKRVSYGNAKTGIPSINLLAGDRETLYSGYAMAGLKEYIRENNVCGTCSGTCPGCYALKTTRYPEVCITDILNTIEARLDPERFFKLIEAELDRDGWPGIVRIHDSGDFVTYDYFKECMNFIIRHPGTRFYGYTKEAEFCERYGIAKVEAIGNLSLSCSPWPGHCEPIGDLPQFWYDNHKIPAVAKMPHCPAVDRDGKRTGVQCKDCRHCPYAKPGDVWAVYAH